MYIHSQSVFLAYTYIIYNVWPIAIYYSRKELYISVENGGRNTD